MSATVDIEDIESIEEMEEQLDELRIRRHDLEPENREDLKDFEEAIRYGIEGLQGEQYLDPAHLIEATALAALPDDMIPEDQYLWDDEKEERTRMQNQSGTITRTLEPDNHTPSERPVERELGRPVDEIIEDLPQNLQQADEMFSRPPQKEEVEGFYDAAKELLNKSDFDKYDVVIEEAIKEGDLAKEEIQGLREWGDDISNALLAIQEIGNSMIEYKQDRREEIDSQKHPDHVSLPESPEEFNYNFTLGLIEGYAGAVELFEEAEEREQQTSTTQNSQREPLKEYQQQIKVDQSALPDNASTYEKQLFDAGARYNHESEDQEVDVDMMRQIIRDVRGFDVSDEMTPSYEDKQAEAYGDLKGAVEAIVEDSEMTIGNGAGNRQALNQLVAGINYTESNNGVYEEEHVIER